MVGFERVNFEAFAKLPEEGEERGPPEHLGVIYGALKAVNSILPENFACKGKSLKGGPATLERIKPSSFWFNPSDPGDESHFLLTFPGLQSSTVIYIFSQCSV